MPENAPPVPSTPDPRTLRRLLVSAVTLGTLTVVLAACSLFEDPNAPMPTLPPPPETDVAYGPVTGCDVGTDEPCGGSQTLDIYRSDQPGPNPVLVFIHGGGFVAGDKIGSIPERLDELLDDGWDIVSINYRLTSEDGSNAFPAAVSDSKRAVRWIRANAAAQDWDPAAVAVMGVSAGGNLAGMVATTADQPDLDDPDLPPELAAADVSVIAAIALNPVFDIASFAAIQGWGDLMPQYSNCAGGDCTEGFAQGSVQTHVDPFSAPMIAMHGVNDPLAAPSQGVLVRDAYTAAGIGDRFELIVVDDGPERYQGHEIDYDRFIDQFRDFLDAQRD